jgi:hypothetical protein
MPADREQVAAAQVLHRQEVVTLDLPEVVHLHDVRVLEQRRDARLVDEHLDEVLRGGLLLADALDDELPLETPRSVGDRPVDLGHAPAIDRLYQEVPAEPPALLGLGALIHPSTIGRTTGFMRFFV